MTIRYSTETARLDTQLCHHFGDGRIAVEIIRIGDDVPQEVALHIGGSAYISIHMTQEQLRDITRQLMSQVFGIKEGAA